LGNATRQSWNFGPIAALLRRVDKNLQIHKCKIRSHNEATTAVQIGQSLELSIVKRVSNDGP
jgi:hypothetical protein